MFKKFDQHADIVSTIQLKNSAQKAIRNRIVQLYPNVADYIEEILPKKETFKTVKCKASSLTPEP